MTTIPKIIKGGNGIPDNYCIKAKDFISDEECKEINKKRNNKTEKQKEEE